MNPEEMRRRDGEMRRRGDEKIRRIGDEVKGKLAFHAVEEP